MPYHTKRHTKRMSSKKYRRGKRMMKSGGYHNPNSQLNASTYVSTSNASGPVGEFNQQMQVSDSSAYAHSNALDYGKINSNIMSAAQSGANAMQSGANAMSGGNRNKQYGGVWNQMIGDAIAPLVLLGLQQYYGPRSQSRMHKKSYKGRMTKKYRK